MEEFNLREKKKKNIGPSFPNRGSEEKGYPSFAALQGQKKKKSPAGVCQRRSQKRGANAPM